MLKRRLSKSEKFAALKYDKARVLYCMMLPFTDVKGRLEANPKIIKGEILPLMNYSPGVIQSCLEELHRVGLIVLYKIDGGQYLEYVRFGDFQTIKEDREAKSEIPDPQEKSGVTPEYSGVNQENSPLSLSLSKDKLREDKELACSFEIFWKKFPGRLSESGKIAKVGKHEALTEWRKLSEAERQKALTAVPVKPEKYLPDACRWLKYKRFEDNPEGTKELTAEQKMKRWWENYKEENKRFILNGKPEAVKVRCVNPDFRKLVEELKPEILK